MKKPIHLLSALTLAVLLAVRVNAGEPYVAPAPAPAPEGYGMGWYGAIQAGANIFQDRGDGRVSPTATEMFSPSSPRTTQASLAGLAGLRLRNRGVRFALEEDMFYNGWQSGTDSR